MTKAIAENRGEIARAQLRAAVNKPAWHIRESALSLLAAHVSGPVSLYIETAAAASEEADPGYEVTAEGIAVVSIHGPLLDAEPCWWMDCLGYASTPGIARAVATAAEDANVKDILLHIDSPGGMVSGLAAACDAVYAVRQNQGGPRIVAACKEACSAAYEIASQCERIYLSQDGDAGCLGTMIDMADWSGYFKAQGIERFVIASDGAETYKGEGSPGVAVTKEQRADFKRLVNEYRSLFDGILDRGRGWGRERIATLTDGRTHIGANALALGLVDGIMAPEEVLRLLGSNADLSEGEESPPEPPEPDGPTEKRKVRQEKLFNFQAAANRAAFVLPAANGPSSIPLAQGASTTTHQNGYPPATIRALEETRMKDKLVRALTAFGLGRMAVAVLGSNSDEPEALAATMAEQVKAEAKELVDAHPLVLACRAAGISDALTFQARMAEAALGREYLSELRADAKAQAIRAKDQDLGQMIAEQVDSQPAPVVKALRDAWKKEADAKIPEARQTDPARPSSAKEIAEQIGEDDAPIPESVQRVAKALGLKPEDLALPNGKGGK